jgi:decaprenylphospho-beta-D-erythro-pentofuranosid-2-ulose 2-reductase
MSQSTMKKIVIIGGTSAMAQHCARRWVQAAAVHLVLAVRNAAKAQSVAADLKVRSPGSTIDIIEIEFLDPQRIAAFAEQVSRSSVPDIVLIAHGSLPDQSTCQADLSECREALEVNGVSPILFAEAFAGQMQQAGRGTLALIGSVAGDRGRKSNYTYGAAKGMVTRYVQGLQHRLAATNVKIVLIKPGPTETPMTANLSNQGVAMAAVEEVAESIVTGIEAGKLVIYAPAKWGLIMMIIRHLPRFVFNKMNI